MRLPGKNQWFVRRDCCCCMQVIDAWQPSDGWPAALYVGQASLNPVQPEGHSLRGLLWSWNLRIRLAWRVLRGRLWEPDMDFYSRDTAEEFLHDLREAIDCAFPFPETPGVTRAKSVSMSESEREEQRVSFAYGNTKIENEQMTREAVREASKRLKRQR